MPRPYYRITVLISRSSFDRLVIPIQSKMDNFLDLQDRVEEENQRQRVIALAEAVYCCAQQHNPDLSQLKTEIQNLLLFLCSPEGRTDDNCTTVGTHLSCKSDWPHCIGHLPTQLRSVLLDIGGTLHDAIRHPKVASNFESLPEQLLVRVRKVQA